MQNQNEKKLTVRKPVLSKETLRMLSEDDLQQAYGGNKTTSPDITLTASELWGGCTSKWTATCPSVDKHTKTYTQGCE